MVESSDAPPLFKAEHRNVKPERQMKKYSYAAELRYSPTAFGF
jgi:hypothetical protein